MIEYGRWFDKVFVKDGKKRYIIEEAKNNLSIYRFADVREKMLKLIYLNACFTLLCFTFLHF